MTYMWYFVSFQILFLLQTGKTDSYHIKCPSLSQWYIRAKAVCNAPNGYHCLYDENEDHFSDFCRNKPSPDNAGYKAVLVGNIDGRKCDDDRYQPFKYWTNGSDHCAYTKSECNEQGQIPHKEGSIISDRQCRCDYTRGYAFVTMPKNHCFCIPSAEDCSCYIKSCPDGLVLTPDYMCILIDDWKAYFQCDVISDIDKSTVPPTTEIIISTERQDILHKGLETVVVAILVVIFFLLITGFCLLLVPQLFRYGHTESESKADPTILQNMKESEAYEKEYMRNKLQSFVETRATKYIFDTLKTDKCILITGPTGCGKSSLAYWVAFKLEETDNYDFVVLTHPNDILKYAGTFKRRVFVTDDIFGIHVINEYHLKWLNEHSQKVHNLLSENDIKLIITCRTHLYQSMDADKIQLSFKHVNLLDDTLKLTTDERKKIGKSYMIYDIISKLSDDDINMYYCFPSLCASFIHVKCSNPEQLFKYPYNFFHEEFERFDKKSDVFFFTLALLVVKNNSIEKEFFNSDNDDHDKLLKNLKELGCNNLPLDHLINSCLKSMVNTFTRESTSGYCFLTEHIFQIAANCIGKCIIKTLLKYGKFEFLKNRFHLQLVPDMSSWLSEYSETSVGKGSKCQDSR